MKRMLPRRRRRQNDCVPAPCNPSSPVSGAGIDSGFPSPNPASVTMTVPPTALIAVITPALRATQTPLIEARIRTVNGRGRTVVAMRVADIRRQTRFYKNNNVASTSSLAAPLPSFSCHMGHTCQHTEIASNTTRSYTRRGEMPMVAPFPYIVRLSSDIYNECSMQIIVEGAFICGHATNAFFCSETSTYKNTVQFESGMSVAFDCHLLQCVVCGNLDSDFREGLNVDANLQVQAKSDGQSPAGEMFMRTSSEESEYNSSTCDNADSHSTSFDSPSAFVEDGPEVVVLASPYCTSLHLTTGSIPSCHSLLQAITEAWSSPGATQRCFLGTAGELTQPCWLPHGTTAQSRQANLHKPERSPKGGLRIFFACRW